MRLLGQVLWRLAHLSWLRFQCWRIPLMTRVELSLAQHLRLGAAFHFWRAGRMMGMPRLPGESTAAYGDRLMREQIERTKDV